MGEAVTGVKWVAGGWLASRLAWREVEACLYLGRSAAPKTKPELNLAALQPVGNARLAQEQRWKSHLARQADLGGSAVPLSGLLCLGTGCLSPPPEVFGASAWGKGPLKPSSACGVAVPLP